jgi:hypothetical protein
VVGEAVMSAEEGIGLEVQQQRDRGERGDFG